MCHTQKCNKPITTSTPTTWMNSTFNWQLRIQTVPSASTATSASNVAAASTAAVSRRPVLSVRRRIINSPTSASASASAASASFESGTQISELPTSASTTSKYNRLRSKPAATATTTTLTTTSAAATPSATSNKNSNSYLSKLKTKSSSANAEPATLALATLLPATGNTNKLQAALRRQFQTRRLTTTASPSNADESATDVPRTQNPLFKRRPTLTTAITPQRPTTTGISIETTTLMDGIEIDDEDQVAKSSIHTSRFNQIPEQVRPRVNYELPTTTTATISSSSLSPLLGNSTRRQLIPRPRRPQSTTAPSVTAALSPPLSRRQQSRRRPHKYIEVYSRPPSKPSVTTATSASKRRPGAPLDYEYYDDASIKQQTRRRNGLSQAQMQTQSPAQLQSQSQPKVIVHGRGIIECLEQGNFPHPLSCRKFISCAKFEGTGGIVGWEYTCPKGLGYDGLSGMCTWAAPNSEGRVCR